MEPPNQPSLTGIVPLVLSLQARHGDRTVSGTVLPECEIIDWILQIQAFTKFKMLNIKKYDRNIMHC